MNIEDEAYRQLLERLFAARRFGVVLGLGRMHQVLARLGDPHRRLGAIVHVGGTNGKGSTAAMIAAMVSAHGRPVALYTSPHLTSVRERIAVDGAPISKAEFLDAAAAVAAVGGEALTFFEQLTALAMVAMAQRRPAVTVLEVGLGGRLDATNVVDSAVAVVTGVALDHQAVLGDTLELIAAEKAGIFRRDRPAIIGASGEPAAVPVLQEAAVRAGAQPVQVVDAAAVAATPSPGLRGAHQRRNAAAALAAVRALVDGGHMVEDAAARARGLSSVQHPGRFEVIAGAPRLVLDGAHNPHGAHALAEALAGEPAPRVLVLAVSRDKDARALIAALAPAVTCIVATAYRQERALPAAELAAQVAEVAPRAVPPHDSAAGVGWAAALPDALAQARHLAGPAGTVVIAGSLFLVGEARALLLGAEQDPLALSDPAATPSAPPPG